MKFRLCMFGLLNSVCLQNIRSIIFKQPLFCLLLLFSAGLAVRIFVYMQLSIAAKDQSQCIQVNLEMRQ
jgi:hypothetical protein